jgi:hypothetical protein
MHETEDDEPGHRHGAQHSNRNSVATLPANHSFNEPVSPLTGEDNMNRGLKRLGSIELLTAELEKGNTRSPEYSPLAWIQHAHRMAEGIVFRAMGETDPPPKPESPQQPPGASQAKR